MVTNMKKKSKIFQFPRVPTLVFPFFSNFVCIKPMLFCIKRCLLFPVAYDQAWDRVTRLPEYPKYPKYPSGIGYKKSYVRTRTRTRSGTGTSLKPVQIPDLPEIETVLNICECVKQNYVKNEISRYI